MELNEQSKNELREKIIKAVENMPYGTRAHIDKNVLENLLFKKVVFNRDTGETLKLPIWSGDFLKKIDLSEVDFEDVSWSLVVEDGYDFPEQEYKEYMDKKTYDEFSDILPVLEYGERVNYSNTNAKIDFKKSFEYKKTGRNIILFCDFSFVDLSNNTLNAETNAYECNFANTKINIDNTKSIDRNYVGEFYCCDLTNLDLSKFNFDLFIYMDGRTFFSDCDLINTGANFIFDLKSDYLEKRKQFKGFYPEPETYIESGRYKEDICEFLPSITGCNINGKKVLSKEELKELKKQKLEEYMAYKKGLFKSFGDDFKNNNGINL